jgi:hypothetical protein
MAIKLFNSVAGFAVGEIPANIILANGDITTTNITTTGVSNLNSVGNVKISGGTSGQYLQTDGSGNLVWATVTGSGISNGNSNVNIPAANGNIQISVAGVSNVITFASNNAYRGSYGLTGIISQANTAPANPQNGDQWYNTFNGILFEYIDDGTSLQWVDISSLPLPNVSATTAGTVTTAAQPNITSVGTLTGLTVGNATANTVFGNGTVNATGNVNGANFVASSYLIRSVDSNITAAGSTQGTATALTKEFNLISNVSSGTGVALPTAVSGMAITVINGSANALLVYPAVNGIINSQLANIAYTQSAYSTLQFVSITTTQWYTVGASNATQRIGMFATTTPTSSEPLVLYCVPNALKFPADFAGSTGAIAASGTNPAASFVMPVFKNATQIGTITISTSGVFSFATTGGLEQLVAANDVIRILGPAIPDTTITNITATLILQEPTYV